MSFWDSLGNAAIFALDPANLTGFQDSFGSSAPTPEGDHPPLPSAVDLNHPPEGWVDPHRHVVSNPGGYHPVAPKPGGFMASMGGWGYVPGKGPQWGTAGNYSSPGGFGQGNRI